MPSAGRVPFKSVIAAASMAVLASCATKPPPPPPPPPPRPIVMEAPARAPIPARPVVPNSASQAMVIPKIDASGVRQTVNANLSPAAVAWNLRSALNVAALNCLRPGDEPILEAYKVILKKHASQLSAVNRTLDTEFRQKYGAKFRTVRDQYMTNVYNYFALPPVTADFCDAAVRISADYLLAPPKEFPAYALKELPTLESVFLRFFSTYEQWRVDVDDWDARYGAQYGHIYPDYLEAHRATINTTAFASQIAGQPLTASGATVADPSVYGPVSPQMQEQIEAAPKPGFSLLPGEPDGGGAGGG